MIVSGVSNLAVLFAGRGASLLERRRLRDSDAGPPRRRIKTATKLAGLGALMLLFGTSASNSGVLTENDVKRVEAIKPLFQTLMVDLVETSKRPDISGGDA